MQNMPIGIFRGDDTDAFSYQTIVGTINTDLDLTGCRAVFRYLDFSMEFDPIPEDRKLTIVIPADETKKFPPGLGYASLRVYDSEDRLKTFSNRIMVFVATKTPMFGSDEFEVDFNVRATLEPLKFFVGPNPDDFDEYRGYVEKVIDRASAEKYGLAILLDEINSDLGAADGVAATPVAVKAAYAAIIDKLTDDYYTAEQTDEAIDRVAAYYITSDAVGHPFQTRAALLSAQTYYSGGEVRTPTRNDYAIVLHDEKHQGAEYRYIYAVADGQTVGQWEAQYPIETNDYAALSNKPTINGETLTGNKTADDFGLVDQDNIEGYLSEYADIFKIAPEFSRTTSYGVDELVSYMGPQDEAYGLYKCIAAHTGPWNTQHFKSATVEEILKALRAALAGKASKADVDPLLFAQYYPEGNVKSAAEFTSGIKYDSPDTTNRTITVKPFCNTGTAANDNSSLVGRVVIPPFVDGDGNPFISDDGTRYKVVGVSDGDVADSNTNLTAVVAPITVTTIGGNALNSCTALSSISLPAATLVGDNAFVDCTALSSVSLPAATDIGAFALASGGALTSILLPAATKIRRGAFYGCTSLASIDFGDTTRSSVPTLDGVAFADVPTSCKIIVPYTQYDAWIAADGWKDLQQEFVRHPEKADKPATFTAGNLAKFDAQGNPTDSLIPAANVATKSAIPYALVTKTITNGAVSLDDRASNSVTITATLSPNALTVNFPPLLDNGMVRDFAMRLNIAAGVTAPEIAWPQGVTLENDGGEMPEIADGGTSGSSTILYFSETENDGTTAKFLVKSETLTAITQA